MRTGTLGTKRESIIVPRSDQFEELYRLDQESFGDFEAYTYFFLRQLFDACRHSCLIIVADGRLVGYVLTVHNSGEEQATIMALCVAPEYRGFGYGHKLLDAAISRLRKHAATSVVLVVKPDNKPARNLYRDHGFRCVRRLPDHFGPGRDRVELRLKLN